MSLLINTTNHKPAKFDDWYDQKEEFCVSQRPAIAKMDGQRRLSNAGPVSLSNHDEHGDKNVRDLHI